MKRQLQIVGVGAALRAKEPSRYRALADCIEPFGSPGAITAL